MKTALLLIAFQNNYFIKGSQRIKSAKQSAKAAAKLLAYFRENELPIVHVLQRGKLEELSAEKLQPYELLEPQQDEPSLLSRTPNVFADGKLEQLLHSMEVSRLLIAGLALEKDILASVQAAQSLGYTLTVVQDASAAATLKFEGEKIKADLVQQVVMAMISDAGIEVSSTKAFLKAESKKKKKLEKAAAKQEAILEAARAALEITPEPEAKPEPTVKEKKAGSGAKAKKAGAKAVKGEELRSAAAK